MLFFSHFCCRCILPPSYPLLTVIAMAFSFDHRQRQGFIGVIDALQRLEEDPEQLSLQREQRYNDPPPPYPSSGETTQPASPTEAPVANNVALQARMAMFRSTPHEQFDSHAHRERERIVYQVGKERYGRRQTLPYDETADLLANSQNNVRGRWVEHGIWKEEWGPAWSKGAQPWDNRWHYSSKNKGGPHPCGRWGHEKRPEPKVPEPAPVPEAKPLPNLFSGFRREKPNTTTEESARASVPDVTEAPAATPERDTSASRPYNQFLFQVSKEREWIRDELQFERTTRTIDINAMAYESTKKNWIEDEIWNPKWGELPGTTWMHEDLEDEEEEVRRTSKPQPDAVSIDGQTPHLPSPGPLNSEPMSGVYDGTNSNNSFTAPEEADASSGAIARAGGKRKRTKGTSRLPTVNESPRSAEESVGRVLRSVRSSKVMKPSEPRSTVPNTRFRTQDHRTSRTPRGDANLAPGNKQASTKRPVRTSRRSSLGPAGPGMSIPKSKIEHPRQLNAHAKEIATLQLPSAGALNHTGQRRPTVEDQSIATKEPRRSKRIAAQKRTTPVEIKRKTAVSSTGESKGRSRSTPRATTTPANSNRIRKRQRSTNGGTHARRRSRS